MTNTRRFNRKEISKILKIASELDHRSGEGDDEAANLTLEELKQVASEVGIDGKHVDQALLKLDEVPIQEYGPKWLGGPFSFRKSDVAPGPLKEAHWEEIVKAIRKINGGIGRTNKIGRLFEWEQRKSNVGYLQVSVTAGRKNTKIQLSASYHYYAWLTYFYGILFGFIFFTIFGVSFIGDQNPEWLYGLIGGLTGFAGARIYLKRWFNKKKKRLSAIVKRIRGILHPTASVQTETENEPTGAASGEVELPGAESEAVQDPESREGRIPDASRSRS